MKLIGQQKSLLKLAAVLFAVNILGITAAYACSSCGCNPPPSNGDDSNVLGCGDNSATVYAYTVMGSNSSSEISSVQSGLTWYSYNGTDYGYGITNSGYDYDHSIDNSGYTDFLALNFTSGPVALDSVSFGWVNGDGDFSVLALNPGKDSTLAGRTIGNLTSSGAWTLVGNYSNNSAGMVSVNSGSVTSSWWIISAYNSNFGGSTEGIGGGNDFMKVLAVACKEPGDDGKVPEPGSMVLLGAGLFGMMTLRRRRQTEV